MLHVLVARSSSNGVAIRYVLLVLWMTSCFHIIVLWRGVCILKQRYDNTGTAAEIPTKFCSTIKTGSTHCELLTGGEVCYIRLPSLSIDAGFIVTLLCTGLLSTDVKLSILINVTTSSAAAAAAASDDSLQLNIRRKKTCIRREQRSYCVTGRKAEFVMRTCLWFCLSVCLSLAVRNTS